MSHDSRLQQAVLSELAWEPSVTAAHIGVTANGGVVSLTGHVESFVEKHAAESAARRVRGLAFAERRGGLDSAESIGERRGQAAFF
jgi:osmotically-inducible protein OsmY